MLIQVRYVHCVLPTGSLAHLLGWTGQKVIRGKGAGDVAGQAGTGREQQQPPLLRAPCPSPRQAHAEAGGGVGGQPAVAAAPRRAGGTRLLLEVHCQASPKMGFLNLRLHLRERSEMAAGAQRQQNSHPFPSLWFSLLVGFFFFLSKSIERDGSECSL